MQLIDDWKKAWKLLSIQANVLGASIIGSYSLLPEKFQAAIPEKWVLGAAGVTFIAGVIGRVVAQPDALPKPPDEVPK